MLKEKALALESTDGMVQMNTQTHPMDGSVLPVQLEPLKGLPQLASRAGNSTIEG
jgi:hypothetical protein